MTPSHADNNASLTALGNCFSAAAPGLYVHIPFCSAICPYCDFSVLLGDADAREAFTRRLVREIELWRDSSSDLRLRGIDTIHFGGGTPTALAPEQLARILEAARAHLDLEPDAWLFLEANPEDVTAEAVVAWQRLGVRTLSLGVQSFHDDALRFLGRRHDGQQARDAAHRALDAGFHSVSIDVIYGLPEDSPARLLRDLEIAVQLQPQHLSCYQLTIHQGTPFGFRHERGQLDELPNDDQAELFRLTHTFLADHGLPAYEVSNFAASPEHQSRHNRKYWNHTPYLGLGPSAHSFHPRTNGDRLLGGRRWWNVRKIKPWNTRLDEGARPIDESEELRADELAFEALMLGLRTSAGLDVETFHQRYGVDLLAANGAYVDDLEARGLLQRRDHHLVPTLDGFAVADSVACGFQLHPTAASHSSIAPEP